MQTADTFHSTPRRSAPVRGGNLIPYDFEGVEIRVVDLDGQPRWILVDVCRVLGIANSRDAAARLDDDEKDDVGITDAIGRLQKTTIINESGLYALILASRKPAAKRFKKWVTSEVIPSIRRTGGYSIAPEPAAEPETLESMTLKVITALSGKVAAQEQVIAQQAGHIDEQLENMKELVCLIEDQHDNIHEQDETIRKAMDLLDQAMPKADVHDRIASADGSITITETAKTLGVPPRFLVEWMDWNGWIYRRGGSGPQMGYQDKLKSRMLTHKVTTIHDDGTEKIVGQVRVTPKGLALLARRVPGAVK